MEASSFGFPDPCSFSWPLSLSPPAWTWRWGGNCPIQSPCNALHPPPPTPANLLPLKIPDPSSAVFHRPPAKVSVAGKGVGDYCKCSRSTSKSLARCSVLYPIYVTNALQAPLRRSLVQMKTRRFGPVRGGEASSSYRSLAHEASCWCEL